MGAMSSRPGLCARPALCENLPRVTPLACCKCRTRARSSVWKRQDELSHRFFRLRHPYRSPP
eukprot:6894992-Prymnesium_polylepis.1